MMVFAYTMAASVLVVTGLCWFLWNRDSYEHLDTKKIARIYHVPYWLLADAPKPPWRKSPIWRLRVLWWRRKN